MLLIGALALGLVDIGSGGTTINSISGLATGNQSHLDNNTFRTTLGGQMGSGKLNQIDYEWITIGDQCLTSQRAPQHLYYQIGSAFFLLAFVAPTTAFGVLWLRCTLIIGCILFTMWAYLIECMPDVILWSALFLFVNFIHMIIVLCKLRPVKFDKELEAVYVALFKPLRVSRHQFKKVLNCMKLIRTLKFQEIYAQEKVTKVDSLSLVLSGKLVVSQNQKALHIVFPHQFLDSPEWFGVSTDDFFQVSIMAMEETRVLIWHRDKLKLSIISDTFLQTVFDHVLGRDVVKKLMQVTQVSETMAQSNGFISSSCEDDEKPMLLMKKSLDNQGAHGLTALINKQLQENVPLLLHNYSPASPRISQTAAKTGTSDTSLQSPTTPTTPKNNGNHSPQHSRPSPNDSNIRTRLITSHVQHEMLNSPTHYPGYYTPRRDFQESLDIRDRRDQEMINNNNLLSQVIVEANGKSSKKSKKAKKHAKNVSEL